MHGVLILEKIFLKNSSGNSELKLVEGLLGCEEHRQGMFLLGKNRQSKFLLLKKRQGMYFYWNKKTIWCLFYGIKNAKVCSLLE